MKLHLIPYSYGNTTAPATGGFSFSTSTTAPAPSGGFSFGTSAPSKTSNATAAGATASGFSFGASAPSKKSGTAASGSATSGFSFGTLTPNQTSDSIATSSTATGANNNITLGSSTPAPAPAASGGFNFGVASSTPAPATEKSVNSTGTDTKSKALESTSKTNSSGIFSFGTSSNPPSTSGATPAVSTNAGVFNFGTIEKNPTADTDKKKGTPSEETTKEKIKDTGASSGAASTSAFNFGTSITGKTKDDQTNSSSAPAPVSFGVTNKTTEQTKKTGDSSDSKKVTFGVTNTVSFTKNETDKTQPTNKDTAKSTSANASIPVQPPPPIPYQTKSIQEIINTLTSELEVDARAFLAEAKRVSEYDAILRYSQRNLSNLTENVSRLLMQQTQVDHALNSIGSHHIEQSRILDHLENNIDDLFDAQRYLSPEDGDLERERAYQRAIDVDTKLGSMSLALKDTVDDLNLSIERVSVAGARSGSDSGAQEGMQILQIMNAHLETLAWLEGMGKSLEEDIAMIGRVVSE